MSGDASNPLTMYEVRLCVKVCRIHRRKDKAAYGTFPEQPMIELTDVSKKLRKAAERCYICLKEFNDPHNKKI